MLKPYRILRALLRDRRGAVALLFGLLAIPFIAAAGLGIDLGRISFARAQTQEIADQAALAGAAAYTNAAASSAASGVATRFVTTGVATLPSWVVVNSQTITPASGTTNFSGTSYNVSVQINITVTTAILWFVAGSETFTLGSTASNPFITPVFVAGNFGASAWDWNSAFAYMVPLSNGVPQYASFPAVSDMYEIGSNNSKLPPPASQTSLVASATQPIGFALRNVTGGNVDYGATGCGQNSTEGLPKSNYYGVITGPGSDSGTSGSGQDNWFYSPLEALGEPPSFDSNYTYSYSYITSSNGKCTKTVTNTVTTTYPTTKNCALLITLVSDPSNPPTTPPLGSQCFSTTASNSGYQYAAMSCAQFGGNTYAIWWNDEGGVGSDDLDYNDAFFTVTCKISGEGSGTGNTEVVLTQ